jgi:hypothetical protein
MPKFRRIRAAGLTLALGVLVLVGWRVVGASAAHPALAPAREALSPAVSGTQTTLPFGYGAAEGSGVELTSPTVTPANPLERITVRNVTREPITAVRFVAVLERWPAGRAVDEVEIVSSDLLSVSIPPSASLEFANVPFPPQLVRATSSGDRIQAFFSVQELHFGNGATWSIVPNPNGRNHREALAFPPADLTREFLTKQQTQASPGSVALCYDQNAREYSQGAVVGIRNEPGRTAQCKAGRWEESAP